MIEKIIKLQWNRSISTIIIIKEQLSYVNLKYILNIIKKKLFSNFLQFLNY